MTERAYRNKIINAMKNLGTYNEQYAIAIDTAARLLADYDGALKAFADNGGQIVVEYVNKAGAVNVVKNPHYQAIETLRDQILIYLRELGLTPAGLRKIADKTKQNKGGGLALLGKMASGGSG